MPNAMTIVLPAVSRNSSVRILILFLCLFLLTNDSEEEVEEYEEGGDEGDPGHLEYVSQLHFRGHSHSV